jgi:hypothetical protein
MRPTLLVAILCAGLAGCKTTSGDGCHLCQHAKAPPVVVDVPAAMQAPPAAFNAPMMAAAAAPVTGGGTDLGIHFDCIKIPIPFPRLMAVPRPAQVSIPIAPAGYAAPMPVAMPQPCLPPACGQNAGLQQIMAQLTPQQQQAFLQALATQSNGAAAAAPAAGSKQIDQQLDDLMKACEELKQAKQEREKAWRKAKSDESEK